MACLAELSECSDESSLAILLCARSSVAVVAASAVGSAIHVVTILCNAIAIGEGWAAGK